VSGHDVGLRTQTSVHQPQLHQDRTKRATPRQTPTLRPRDSIFTFGPRLRFLAAASHKEKRARQRLEARAGSIIVANMACGSRLAGVNAFATDSAALARLARLAGGLRGAPSYGEDVRQAIAAESGLTLLSTSNCTLGETWRSDQADDAVVPTTDLGAIHRYTALGDLPESS
jgi:hypothetical protein